MKTRIIYLCLLVIFSTTGCISKNARKGINGNKNIVTRTIQVDDFEEIHLGSNIESAKSINPFNKKNRAICNYTQTDGASSLEISMDENLFDLLDIENKDHKLIIKAKSGKKICPTHLVLNTSSKNLKEAGISGSIDFIADQPLQLTNTSFYISGVGDVKLADLSCDTFKVAISGVGNIYLNGNIKKGKYSVSGVGHVYAFDCPVEDLECEVSGVGGMEVNATQKLDASTSGVGSVKYKGNPEHKISLLFLICGLFLVSSCIPTQTIKGDGNITTENIPVSEYDCLELEGGGMVVNYTQSDAPEGLEIKTDRNIFEKYEFNVENHKLKIRPKKEFRKHTNFRPTEFMVTANSRNLKKLAAAGSTHVNINSPLQAEEFEAGLAGSGIIQFHDTASFTNLKIEIAGSGDFVGHKVYCEELNGDMAGSNTIVLGGTVGIAEFSIAGSGTVRAFDCTMDELECKIAGSGDIEAFVVNKIKAEIAGSGSVKYKGDPQDIQKKVMGSGKIEKVE